MGFLDVEFTFWLFDARENNSNFGTIIRVCDFEMLLFGKL